ncbi:MAG: hypothetical protein ACFNYZ_00245 [Pauljensenia sp.]
MPRITDPRGILTFTLRYLVLHVVFLIGLPISSMLDLALFYFFGFMGFFTFIQVLVSISQKFLDHGLAWKAVVIMGAVASDTVVLWCLGLMLRGLSPNDSDWSLVANWLPLHFFAAFLAWGLRETHHAVNSGGTADPRSPSSPANQGGFVNPSDSEDVDAPTGGPASIDVNADSR